MTAHADDAMLRRFRYPPRFTPRYARLTGIRAVVCAVPTCAELP